MTDILLGSKLDEEQKANLAHESLAPVNVDRPKPFVVACIPAFNEEKYIAKVLLETWHSVNEVIVCDDGSDDSTADIARVFGATILKHERNVGYAASLLSLFKEANRIGADYVVTLDSDGKHDPREIPALLERIKVGDVDIVVGSRFLGGGALRCRG